MYRMVTLCLATALCLALPLSASASASAHFNWSASTKTVNWSGEGPQVFQTNVGTMHCSTLAGETNLGLLSPPVVSLTSSNLSIAGCSLTDPVQTVMEGCNMSLPVIESSGFGTSTYDGNMGISCAKGHSIKFIAAFGACTITLLAQSGRGPVTYTNRESLSGTKYIEVKIEATHLNYKYEGGWCGTGESNNGIYAGTVLLKGLDSAGSPSGIWVE